MLVPEEQDLRRLHPEHPGAALGAAPGVAELDELVAAHLEAPVVGVLARPGVRQGMQGSGVRDPVGDTLDDDVLAGAPAPRTRAAGRNRDVRVALEVAVLLLVGAGAEEEGAVAPDADERNGVRATVS